MREGCIGQKGKGVGWHVLDFSYCLVCAAHLVACSDGEMLEIVMGEDVDTERDTNIAYCELISDENGDEAFVCRYPGCEKRITTRDGMRKHCRIQHTVWYSLVNGSRSHGVKHSVKRSGGVLQIDWVYSCMFAPENSSCVAGKCILDSFCRVTASLSHFPKDPLQCEGVCE